MERVGEELEKLGTKKRSFFGGFFVCFFVFVLFVLDLGVGGGRKIDKYGNDKLIASKLCLHPPQVKDKDLARRKMNLTSN